MATAVELKLPSDEEKKNGPGDDSVKLLSWSINIGRPGEYHRETISAAETHQTHVRGGAGYGVRCTGVVVRVFLDQTLAGPVNFRRGNMNIFLQIISLTQFIMEFDSCDGIGLKPVLRITPTFRNHRLCGKVNHIIRALLIGDFDDCVQIMIEIQLKKLEHRRVSFFIRQKYRV